MSYKMTKVVRFRFAEFMEGSPHITEDEVMEYSHWDAVETDDDDDR